MTSFRVCNETKAFLDAVFMSGQGREILKCLKGVEEHVTEIRRVFRSYDQKRYEQRLAHTCGRTMVQASYNTTSGARITVRFLDRAEQSIALFSGTSIVVAALPETIRSGIRDIPLSHIVDLEHAAKAGFGFEHLLEGNIAKAVPLLGQTALRRYTSEERGQQQDVAIEHYSFLQAEAR